ncbi:MAG: hypothetical protein WCX71_04770 [Candidatus Buchananbacteria bacterium]
MNRDEFGPIAGHKPGRAFAAEKNGRRATIIWQDPPGLYKITALQGENEFENIALDLSEAIEIGKKFLETGELADFQEKGSFAECLAQAAINCALREAAQR